MKFALYVGMFLVGVMSGQMDASAAQGKFEIEPGCIFNKSEARCIVTNKLDETIRCQIKITGKNGSKPVYSHYSNVPLKPHHFTEIELYSEGKFTSVGGTAICEKAI